MKKTKGSKVRKQSEKSICYLLTDKEMFLFFFSFVFQISNESFQFFKFSYLYIYIDVMNYPHREWDPRGFCAEPSKQHRNSNTNKTTGAKQERR